MNGNFNYSEYDEMIIRLTALNYCLGRNSTKKGQQDDYQ